MASVFTPMPLRRVRDALDDPRWLHERAGFIASERR